MKIVTFFLFSLLFWFCPTQTHANHILGGDITYKCLGNGTPNTLKYRFTLRLYRDCNSGGAPFDNPAEMAIYQGFENSSTLFDAFQTNIDSQSGVPTDPFLCGAGINLCVEQADYTFEKDLPILQNQSYFLVYQRCCRPETITNIIDPSNLGMTIMVEIKATAMLTQSSSPVVNTPFLSNACIFEPIEYSLAGADTSINQLVYRFCAPFNGGGNILVSPDLFSCEGVMPTPPCNPPFDEIPFAIPDFTPTAPMGGSPTITINPTTGLITGTPTQSGRFVVGVCIEQFRDGALLSVTRREFTVVVGDFVSTSEPYADQVTARIWPSPLKDDLHLSISNLKADFGEIQLVDALGRQCSKRSVQNGETIWTVQGLASGVYTWTLSDHGVIVTAGKVIKE